MSDQVQSLALNKPRFKSSGNDFGDFSIPKIQFPHLD